MNLKSHQSSGQLSLDSVSFPNSSPLFNGGLRSLKSRSQVENQRIKSLSFSRFHLSFTAFSLIWLLSILLISRTVQPVNALEENLETQQSSNNDQVLDRKDINEKNGPENEYPKILAYCKEPGQPPKSKFTPVKETYTDGESVEYKCDEFISLKQNRTCVKGRWIGPTPVCGAAFKDNDVIFARYIDLDTGNIKSEYNMNNSLSYFQRFGNSFLAERYVIPVRGEGAKNYRLELILEKETQIQMVRVSFSMVDRLINQDIQKAVFDVSAVTVAPGKECSKITKNFVSPWHVNSTRYDFYFFCRSSILLRGYDPELDLSKQITIDTACNVPVKIDFSTLILAEVYNNKNNRSDPLCGMPEVPTEMIATVIQDQSRYSFKCDRNFEEISTTDGQLYVRTCGHDMNWHGELPYCLPSSRCARLFPNKNSTVKIIQYDGIFYTDRHTWWPVVESRAHFRCKNETAIFFGKQTRVCTEWGEWTNPHFYCIDLDKLGQPV